MTRSIALFLVLMSFGAGVCADTLTGTVVKVVDGDTVYVLDSAHQQHKIRLAGIDAPERAQPFGTKAKEHLATLVAGEHVKVDWYKLDRYGRVLGTIRQGQQDVNLEMLRAGLAWHFKRYAHEQPEAERLEYAEAENEARKHERGLWVDPRPVPPGDWRKRNR